MCSSSAACSAIARASAGCACPSDATPTPEIRSRIALPVAGEQRAALARLEDHRGAPVDLQHVLRVECDRSCAVSRRQHFVSSRLRRARDRACPPRRSYPPAAAVDDRALPRRRRRAPARQAVSFATMPSRAVPAATIARASRVIQPRARCPGGVEDAGGLAGDNQPLAPAPRAPGARRACRR